MEYLFRTTELPQLFKSLLLVKVLSTQSKLCSLPLLSFRCMQNGKSFSNLLYVQQPASFRTLQLVLRFIQRCLQLLRLRLFLNQSVLCWNQLLFQKIKPLFHRQRRRRLLRHDCENLPMVVDSTYDTAAYSSID